MKGLDAYITGNYGEDQFRGADSTYERKLESLLSRRDKALRLNLGFQVEQAEALLEQTCPNWKGIFALCGHCGMSEGHTKGCQSKKLS